jgi:uncharacterized protein (TIGR03437 family)
LAWDGPVPASWGAQGTLPPNLALNAAGLLSGPLIKPGAYNFSVQVSSNGITATKSFVLSVNQQNSSLTITTATLPDGNTNASYGQQINVTGGTAPYSYSATGLPAGLTITGGGGLITGAPTAGGIFTVTVIVTDSAGNQASKQYSLTINPGLMILTTSLANGSVGESYFQQISVGGGLLPYLFYGTGLPDGLALTAAGNISGTPSRAGTFTVSISVTDSKKNSVSNDFSLTIYSQPSFSTTSPLPDATAGTVYSQTFGGTGGLGPYNFFLLTPPASLPPGLALTQVGVLSGTPTMAGVYTFTVQLLDQNRNATTRSFQLTVNAASQPLIVSPQSIQFSASPGDISGPLEITVTANGASRVTFGLEVDDGNDGPVQWLKATPKGGFTPAIVTATLIPAPLPTGTYKARISIVSPGAPPIDVLVTLNVSNPPAQLSVAPNIVRGYARITAPRTFDQTFLIKNLGGSNPIPVTLAVVNGSSWIAGVSQSAAMIRANAPILAKVTFNTQGSKAGSYRDAIRVTTPLAAPNDKLDVPVVLVVADQGPVMAIFKNGVRIPARQGNSTSRAQQINVFNLGDPGTSVNWTAQAVRGANLVNIINPRGVSTPGNPASFSVRLTPAATANVGGSSALIQVTDSQSQFSPQYVIVVADVTAATTPTTPDPDPAGVEFVANAGGAAPASQQVTVNTTSTDPVALSISTSTNDGGNWLSATSSSPTTSLTNPAQVTIAVSQGALTAGFYTGQVNLAFGGIVRGVFVALVLKPNGSIAVLDAAVLANPTERAATCTPSAVTIGQTGVTNNFTVPATWPTTISVLVSDDCGNALSGASVAVSFSNGDAPIALTGDFQSGSYSGTWAPAHPTRGMTVTIDATSGSLTPTEMQIGGNVDPNSTPSPSLAIAGLLNNLNPVPGAGLAPGTVTQVYGDNLTTTADSPSNVPLPTSYKGVEALIGGVSAPIYYISKTQLTVQVPVELAPNASYMALLVSGNGYSVPQPVNLVAISPGAVTFADGRIVAQHTDYSFVDSTRPAKSGETLAVYLVGMGATTPSVKSGNAAPLNPLAKVPSLVEVSIDGNPANVSFAGLTPGGVGLYQINFVVPDGLRNGTLDISIKQDGMKANAATLVVGN